MIKLTAETPEEIAKEMHEKRHVLGKHIVEKILYAIDNRMEEVIMDIECPLPIDISVDRPNYRNALEKNLTALVESEEYELAHKVQSILSGSYDTDDDCGCLKI